MQFSSIRVRRRISSIAALLIIILSLLLRIYACRASASPPLPGTISGKVTKKMVSDDLLRKYFPGSVHSLDSRRRMIVDRRGGGFQESKRNVPSCPDPLHN
ncbi:hypothetical protein SAY87_013294 [Trapa incisa]|uniref:Uncharacterized protein n=1 Tax=Trapa incisa TaxID=236973 RepID=A0AAN7KBN5_9MYRT|nr:hypothetical protein SAY87_013294 [Trapa incisa]